MKRKNYTEEQIIGMLKEHETGVTIEDLSRKHGMAKSSLQRWTSKYGGIKVAEARDLPDLENENARLKKLLEDALLEKTANEEACAESGEAIAQAPAGLLRITW